MINIGEALSSYTKVRDGAVDGADCGDLLGYDHSSRKQFEEDFADIIALEEEEFDNDSEMEEDSVFEEDGQNKAEDFEPLFAELQKLGTFSPFAIGGESKLYFSDFHLHVCPVVASTVEFVNLGSIQSLNVESLLGYCEPSSYGDFLEKETKIDPALRLAMECKADRFKIVDEPKPNHYPMEFIYHIRNVVSCNLLKLKFARIKMDHIVLVPNKINIYSENGHFKPHINTPTHDHDPALFIGSVVVCLPSEHTGGNLIVRHAGKEVNFDFAAQSNNPDFVQFAAFYGDCEHEVLPVTSGQRVTITYSILKKTTKEMALSYGDDGPKKNVVTITTVSEFHDLSPAPPILSSLRDHLETALQRSPFIGVFLSHAYTHSGLTAANLKGADKLLYDLLTDTIQLPVSLIPVVTRTHYKVYEREGIDFPECEVRLLKGFADTRLPVHKGIPASVAKDIAFLSGWSVEGLEIYNEYNSGSSDWGDGTVVVDRILIQGAMIIGPLSGAAAAEFV